MGQIKTTKDQKYLITYETFIDDDWVEMPHPVPIWATSLYEARRKFIQTFFECFGNSEICWIVKVENAILRPTKHEN